MDTLESIISDLKKLENDLNDIEQSKRFMEGFFIEKAEILEKAKIFIEELLKRAVMFYEKIELQEILKRIDKIAEKLQEKANEIEEAIDEDEELDEELDEEDDEYNEDYEELEREVEELCWCSITQEDLTTIDASSVRNCLIGFLDFQYSLHARRWIALEDLDNATHTWGSEYKAYRAIYDTHSVSQPFKNFLKTFSKDLKISAKDVAVLLDEEIQSMLDDEECAGEELLGIQCEKYIERKYDELSDELNDSQISRFSDLYELDRGLVQVSVLCSTASQFIERFTKSQKLELVEVLKNNEIAQNRLRQIIENHLESNYDFESLIAYLKKVEKKTILNI